VSCNTQAHTTAVKQILLHIMNFAFHDFENNFSNFGLWSVRCVCLCVDYTFLYDFNDARIVYIWAYD